MEFNAKTQGKARKADIFVDYGFKTNQAPFRSDIIGICRPAGA
jgi:hypothetical protein